MSGYLLDTHVWYRYLAGSRKLPRRVRQVIDRQSDRCWLSPISVRELWLLAERGRVEIDGSFRTWVQTALTRLPLRIAPLNLEVALRSCELPLPHRDPADHLLAATALVYELTLLTLDENLSTAEWLPTISS